MRQDSNPANKHEGACANVVRALPWLAAMPLMADTRTLLFSGADHGAVELCRPQRSPERLNDQRDIA